jgi:CheY-like chemotaxis protein
MSGPPRLDGVRVLVVDDAPYVRDVVTQMLKSSGAQVTAVASAEEALDALQRERPDVLLSDLSMPGKGGYWLIGQVRMLPLGLGGATPAAALTAYTTAEHRASVLRAGYQHHVAKPVGLNELIGVVAILALKEQPSGPRLDELEADIRRSRPLMGRERMRKGPA